MRRLGDLRTLAWLALVAMSAWSVCCLSNGTHTEEEITEPVWSPPLPQKAEVTTPFPTQATPAHPKPKIVSYKYQIVHRFNAKLFCTCYSKLDGPVEAKGIYANQKFADKLHLQERRIQRCHFTVALPPELRQYHEALICVDGKWRHKFLVHVPDYNSDVKGEKYWSVPRDRMSQRGRIDILFTTSGKYASIKQRQRYWMKKDTKQWPIEFWEIVKVAVYDDGSEKEVKQ